MRNRRINTAGLVLALTLLSLSLMSFKCGGGCADTDPRCNAARAADAIAKSIGELNNVKREFARQGKLSAAEELKLTQQLLRLNTADKALVNRLDSLTGMPTGADRQQLLSLFNEVTAAVDELNTNGVLGLSDQGARDRLSAIITAIRSSAAIIQSFVNSSGGGGSTGNSNANSNM